MKARNIPMLACRLTRIGWLVLQIKWQFWRMRDVVVNLNVPMETKVNANATLRRAEAVIIGARVRQLKELLA